MNSVDVVSRAFLFCTISYNEHKPFNDTANYVINISNCGDAFCGCSQRTVVDIYRLSKRRIFANLLLISAIRIVDSCKCFICNGKENALSVKHAERWTYRGKKVLQTSDILPPDRQYIFSRLSELLFLNSALEALICCINPQKVFIFYDQTRFCFSLIRLFQRRKVLIVNISWFKQDETIWTRQRTSHWWNCIPVDVSNHIRVASSLVSRSVTENLYVREFAETDGFVMKCRLWSRSFSGYFTMLEFLCLATGMILITAWLSADGRSRNRLQCKLSAWKWDMAV